ncbi:unnamed protein product, partial [Discosporangium mesarthrocarpum]
MTFMTQSTRRNDTALAAARLEAETRRLEAALFSKPIDELQSLELPAFLLMGGRKTPSGGHPPNLFKHRPLDLPPPPVSPVPSSHIVWHPTEPSGNIVRHAETSTGLGNE